MAVWVGGEYVCRPEVRWYPPLAPRARWLQFDGAKWGKVKSELARDRILLVEMRGLGSVFELGALRLHYWAVEQVRRLAGRAVSRLAVALEGRGLARRGDWEMYTLGFAFRRIMGGAIYRLVVGEHAGERERRGLETALRDLRQERQWQQQRIIEALRSKSSGAGPV